MEIDTAQRVLDRSGQFGGLLDVSKSCTDNALDTVRSLSQLLHPSLLDLLGLPAALDRHLQQFSKRTRIRCDLKTAGVDGRLVPELEACIYRVAQEGMTNVARHSGARTCHVELRRRFGKVLMTITDDGRGFDLRQQQSRQDHPGLGLLGVQERVAAFGGTMQVDASPGRGTSLNVELPCLLRPSEDEDDLDFAGAEVRDRACS